jgi:hypothetical protein
MQKKLLLTYVRLVYDLRELPGIMTVRPQVIGVFQLISEPTLVVLWARTN